MTNRIRSIVAAAAFLALPGVASAQGTGDPRLAVGYTDIGAVIGLGGIGDAGLAFGGRFERVIRTMPDLGNGTLGIGASVNYYNWSQTYFGSKASWSYIPIGVTANYHFNLTNKKFVPFLGAGLGYELVTCEYTIAGSSVDYCSGYNSGIYFIGRAGARYFLQDNLTAYADVGAGGATINLGLTYRIR